MAASRETWAGVYYDLRLQDGSHQVQAELGEIYTLELWGRVSGADTTLTNDGLQSSYVKIVSTQTNGGSIISGGFAPGSGTLTSEFMSFTGTSPVHRNGEAADLNGDGILDWGSSSTVSANTGYMLARANAIVPGGGTIGRSVDASTWEFKLATFTVNVNAVSTGTTQFSIVKPNATAGIAITYAAARVDGAAYSVQSTSLQNAYASSLGVTFTGADPNQPPVTHVVSWDGGAGGTGTEWMEPTNWALDSTTSTEHVPKPKELAVFDGPSLPNVVGINLAGSTNNGAANQSVGAVGLGNSATHGLTLQNSSSVAGSLTLTGTPDGTYVYNSAPNTTLAIQGGPSAALELKLGGVSYSGVIGAASGATISISSAITGAHGIDVQGSGTLILSGDNTFSGGLKVGNIANVNLTANGSLAGSGVDVNGTMTIAGALTNPNAVLQILGGQVTLTSAAQKVNYLGGFAGSLSLQGTALTVDSGSIGALISGSGSLTKTSSGTLELISTSSYTGGTTVLDGYLQGNANSIRGDIVNHANVTFVQGLPGTYAGNMSGTGGLIKNGWETLVLSGNDTFTGQTKIIDGVLKTPTHNINGNVLLSGGTLQFDQAVNSTYGGQITGFGSFTKSGAGTITVASDTHAGNTTVTGGRLLLTQSPARLLNAGSAVTIDPSAQLGVPAGLDVSGGAVTNNGTLTGDISVHNGGTLQGAGLVEGSVSIFGTGRFSPGNSPGTATVSSMTFGPGGNYLFEINNANGASGLAMDLLNVQNSLFIDAGNTTGSTFVIALASLDGSNVSAALSGFNPSQEYHWVLAHTGGIVGFAQDRFSVDAGSFLPATGSYHFNVTTSGTDLLLNYNPVPEPGMGVLVLGTITVMVGTRRRSAFLRTCCRKITSSAAAS
ncbi:MAG TPA: autotransporter-associated beta strand repeat-containing protein [Tepidisphaeraceae bacterium]